MPFKLRPWLILLSLTIVVSLVPGCSFLKLSRETASQEQSPSATILLRSVDTGELQQTLSQRSGTTYPGVSSLIFTLDGHLASCSGKTIQLWQLDTGKLIYEVNIPRSTPGTSGTTYFSISGYPSSRIYSLR